VHRLPRLQVNVDLSLRLLSARSAGHGDVKGRLTHLPHATFSRFKKAREVAHKNRVRDSYPHGRKNACSGYRHISSLPTDQDEVTRSGGYRQDRNHSDGRAERHWTFERAESGNVHIINERSRCERPARP
jgi:hypothetical protein